MKLKLVAAAILGLSTAGASFAANPFVVKDIRVEGLQRTEPGTVFSYLPIKVGDTFTDARASESIKALFATGFFNDVRVETAGDVVIVGVVERPVIAQLTINGAKEFDKDQLKKALKDNGLSESRIFDQALLDGAVQELKRQYYSRGKYSVEITPQITRLERNRIAVTLDITEGITAKIREIRVVGAHAFSESDLLDEFSQTTGGWLSWLTKDDQYSKQKLTGDLEKLRAWYQNQGYLEFNIDSSQVAISADKQDMYLVINISEGKPFKVGELKLAGDLKVPEATLRSLIAIKTGEVFSREKITDTVNALTDRLGQEGYAFANVNVSPDIDREKGIAGFTFFVDPGRKTYVRRVSITGNSRTRDEVIRRELRQLEGATYDAAAIKRSKERVELLSFFEDVTVTTPAVAEAPDQVDMNVNVKERSTGSVSAGVGYSQGDGMLLNASISQSNIFGSGKALSLSVGTGKVNKTFALNFTDPYFTPDGVSLGYGLYHKSYNPEASSLSTYKTTSDGVSLNMGVPVTEYDKINYGVGFDSTKIGLFDNSPQRYIDYVKQYGSTNTTVSASVGWSRDRRDSALWPTRGYTVSTVLDGGTPAGDIQYYRVTGNGQYFFPLSKTFTLALSSDLGYIQGYGKTSRVPFFNNFYVGGIGSVRGYDNGSLGPKDTNGDSLGGTMKAVGNAEILFPFPGMRDNKSVRLSVFFDAGSVWDPKEAGSSAGDAFRYSTGGALTWLSPMGPMKFSYAKPLVTKTGDKSRRFQFTLGTVF